jgi:hypothetical protein
MSHWLTLTRHHELRDLEVIGRCVSYRLTVDSDGA